MDEVTRAARGAGSDRDALRRRLDAGQDAVNVARAFNEALPLTGIVLTKLDGDARGGAALSVRHVTGKPIKFVGVSEKLDGLEAFHPERMASRILGMGDILSLVEEARAKVDEKEAHEARRRSSRRARTSTSRTSSTQLQQMKKMGGIASLAGQVAGADHADGADLARAAGEGAQRAPRRIINSMTAARARASLSSSRPRASAASPPGAGRPGAGGQPAAHAVRADAEDDEDDARRQPRQDDAQHEGHVAADALNFRAPLLTKHL